MARKKLRGNAPCPCGSGKKYKHCCWGKEFDWVEGEDGAISRAIPISDEAPEILEDLRDNFVEDHGREPTDEDLVFPDMPHFEHLKHMMVEDMKLAGIDPAVIHAFEKTGLLVT
jgi:hypothetical protein